MPEKSALDDKSSSSSSEDESITVMRRGFRHLKSPTIAKKTWSTSKTPQSEASFSSSSVSSSTLQLRKANVRGEAATSRRHCYIQCQKKKSTDSTDRHRCHQQATNKRKNILDSSSSDDDDIYLSHWRSTVGTDDSKIPQSRSNSNRQKAHGDIDYESDDTAELIKKIQKNKRNYQSTLSPTMYSPPASVSKRESKRDGFGVKELSLTIEKSPNHQASSSPLAEHQSYHTLEDPNNMDADDESSVDTVKLCQRCPLKPGEKRSDLKIASAEMPKRHPDDAADHHGVESLEAPSPVKWSSPKRQHPSPQSPKGFNLSPTRPPSTVQFQLPEKFDSSSSSESEDEALDIIEKASNQNDEHDINIDDKVDLGTLRPTNIVASRAQKPSNHRNNSRLYNPYNKTSGRQDTKRSTPQQSLAETTSEIIHAHSAHAVGHDHTANQNSCLTRQRSHGNSPEHYKTDHSLFQSSFLGDSITKNNPGPKILPWREAPLQPTADATQRPRETSHLHDRSQEELYDSEFNDKIATNAITESQIPPNNVALSRIGQSDEDLFCAAFIAEDRTMEPIPSHPRNAHIHDHETMRYETRQGFSRRELPSSTSPAYNVAARTFLNRRSPRHQEKPTIEYSEVIDLIDDCPAEEADFYRKPAPRRITEDHAQHQDLFNKNTCEEPSQYPGRIGRPWDRQDKPKRKPRIRDPSASNHSMAASVVPRKCQEHAERSKDGNPTTSTNNKAIGGISDIRRYFREPLVNGNAQIQRELIRSQRHDLNGHSEVVVVNPPAAPRRPMARAKERGENVLEDDDIVEVFEDESNDRTQLAAGRRQDRNPRPKRKQGGNTSSRSRGNSGRKRRKNGNSGWGRKRGRGRGGKTNYIGRGVGGNTNNIEGAWGEGGGAAWASTPSFRREDPAFDGIGAEISF
ncbi:hypothetical protein IV203_022028 [Nitzschia inconspicua]|uniref:Uncharacterized protein n=1 Tax=Nitzschia inconspicua TaxID=303405 RepID=A0A9K3PED4_9STRA|nr:hypothetical protein IV203_022028 [Nitzschia inconspicua]